MVESLPINQTLLVGGFSQPLWKMMEWKSVGIMKFHEIPKYSEYMEH